MGTETDLVNVVNKRKLQHFSHVVRNQNICCVTFLKAAQSMRKLPSAHCYYYKQFAHCHE